ncbi:MAG: 6-phosphogluconolactonase, partial [Candidatus Promineifilaceae bacterium]|nr:6-phosphogluconolactonase [Candidatus Promineifilaceae bacterium]
MSRSNSELSVRVFKSKNELARGAAEHFSELALQAVAARGRFSVALSGGSTPQLLFSLLAVPPFATNLPWNSIHFYWGDERLVPPEDPGSNYYHASRLLLNHIPVPDENIHRIKGELPAAEAVHDTITQLQKYRENERTWLRFDLVLLGMGSDGHTASLFPGTPGTEDPGVFVKSVNAVYENRPAQRVTLTPPLINNARHILFLVTGADKAQALSAVLNGPRDLEKWPAQRIQPDPAQLTWYIDQE